MKSLAFIMISLIVLVFFAGCASFSISDVDRAGNEDTEKSRQSCFQFYGKMFQRMDPDQISHFMAIHYLGSNGEGFCGVTNMFDMQIALSKHQTTMLASLGEDAFNALTIGLGSFFLSDTLKAGIGAAGATFNGDGNTSNRDSFNVSGNESSSSSANTSDSSDNSDNSQDNNNSSEDHSDSSESSHEGEY